MAASTRRAPTRARRRTRSGESNEALRAQLVRLLTWHDAHVDFDRAVEGLPAALRGRRPRGVAWSAWELVEHLRLAQRDILDFCLNPNYAAQAWPDDYWPGRPAPPKARAWAASIAAFHRDLAALVALARDPATDLFARIPHGSGQTILRELLLVADHNAYHVGQIVAVRRTLGCWPG
jgi:uncharacterized damage-inducible protein DinB